jgi:hypothetical protein
MRGDPVAADVAFSTASLKVDFVPPSRVGPGSRCVASARSAGRPAVGSDGEVAFNAGVAYRKNS